MDALGPQQTEFKENTTATVTTFIIGLACIGLGVVMGKMTIFWDEDAGIFNRILFALGSIASLVGGVASVIMSWQNRGARVALHENGVLVERGGKQHTARWEEIIAVTEKIEKVHVNGQHIYDRYLYTIDKRDGESFALSNMVSGVDKIGRALKEETFARLYPQVSEAMQRGEKVSFGTLAIDANGVESNGARFLWTQLAGVKIKDGVIEVKDRNGKAIVSGQYGFTPNAHVLLALLEKRLPLE